MAPFRQEIVEPDRSRAFTLHLVETRVRQAVAGPRAVTEVVVSEEVAGQAVMLAGGGVATAPSW
jgi:hypothetical protein